jgi:hypothetical protein
MTVKLEKGFGCLTGIEANFVIYKNEALTIGLGLVLQRHPCPGDGV